MQKVENFLQVKSSGCTVFAVCMNTNKPFLHKKFSSICRIQKISKLVYFSVIWPYFVMFTLCCFSTVQDGKKLLTGCNDKSLRVFSIKSDMTKPDMTLKGHQSAIKCAVWGKDSHLVVSAAEESELK